MTRVLFVCFLRNPLLIETLVTLNALITRVQ